MLDEVTGAEVLESISVEPSAEADTAEISATTTDPELSALGAAHLAGLGAGLWDRAALARLPRAQHEARTTWSPQAAADARQRWSRAVAQARHAGA